VRVLVVGGERGLRVVGSRTLYPLASSTGSRACVRLPHRSTARDGLPTHERPGADALHHGLSDARQVDLEDGSAIGLAVNRPPDRRPG